jgi:hypothetical protein
MSAIPAAATARQEALALSCLRGVARVAAVLHDDDGSCLLTAEIPYDAMALIARCSEQEMDLFVAVIA